MAAAAALHRDAAVPDDAALEVVLARIGQLVNIDDNYDFDTQVLVASVRRSYPLVRVAEVGADVATIPYRVILQLLTHPHTDIGLARFLADAKQTPP